MAVTDERQAEFEHRDGIDPHALGPLHAQGRNGSGDQGMRSLPAYGRRSKPPVNRCPAGS